MSNPLSSSRDATSRLTACRGRRVAPGSPGGPAGIPANRSRNGSLRSASPRILGASAFCADTANTGCAAASARVRFPSACFSMVACTSNRSSLVPQHVNLVQHRHVVNWRGDALLLPDFPGPSASTPVWSPAGTSPHAHWDDRQGQFGLGTQCVESGRNPESSARPAAGDADNCPWIAPRGTSTVPSARSWWRSLDLAIPEPQLDGLYRRHQLGLGELFRLSCNWRESVGSSDTRTTRSAWA